MPKRRTACFLGDGEINENTGAEIFSIVDALVAKSVETFLFSADSLFCLECALQVLLRRKKQKGNLPDRITLYAYLPYENHIDDKDEFFRKKYFSVLEKCDNTFVYAKGEDEFIFSDFSEYIILRSDILVCPEKGAEYEKLFAEARGRKIIKAVTK